MQKINSLLTEKAIQQNKVERFLYTYDEYIAIHVWNGIVKLLICKPKYTTIISKCWRNLIQYVHGDPECDYDLEKSILLMGQTGSGKSETMKIMNEYSKFDKVLFRRNGKIVKFEYKIISARTIFDEYCSFGFDGIMKYMILSNICIDDLGAEPAEGLHFGVRLNVIAHVIEKRHEKGLTTHFTTNLNEELISSSYNDRVYSRIVQTCNIIELNDCDFRKIKKD